MTDKNIRMAEKIAAAVSAAGGRTYYVGGYVRDRLLGRENKDIDVEIHGVSVQTLEGILDGLGERTVMGVSFGVMGLRHYEIDIAMPRSERATGRGHKDFEVFVDPFIGEEKAARRRDFTMNALMQDVLTGEILDFFGGQADMRRGLIRHVNDATFVEDPLRVFRAAQFAARFGFEVAPETSALSAGMAVDALARERVSAELEKAMGKAERPSIFYAELRRMRQLGTWFAELDALDGARWREVLRTLDAAAECRGAAREPLNLLLAATCVGLDGDGARRFLTRLTSETSVLRYALNMHGVHRAVGAALRDGADTDGWMAIYDGSVQPEDLILLERAVRAGDGWPETEARMRGLLALYRARMAAPCLMGRDLMLAGVEPGPRMGRALQYAHALRLAGVPKDVQMERTLDWLRGEMI